MPLYDILNEFQKGNSHMAAVVNVKRESNNLQAASDFDKSRDEKFINHNTQLTMPLLTRSSEKAENAVVNIEKRPGLVANKQTFQQNGVATNGIHHYLDDIEDGEVIGIITLDDVFEELLQVTSSCSFILFHLFTCLAHE